MNNTTVNINIEEAFAVYSGGNIWLFHGKLKDGSYFLTDDYGSTLVLDADPSDFDESLEVDWQKEHKKVELPDEIRLVFCQLLTDKLLEYESSDNLHRGGISDREIEDYRRYFINLLRNDSNKGGTFSYKKEFPKYPSELYVPEGFTDNSWHHDELPKASKFIEIVNGEGIEVNIWQNVGYRKDIGYTYALQITAGGKDIALYSTDDIKEIELLIRPWQNA